MDPTVALLFDGGGSESETNTMLCRLRKRIMLVVCIWGKIHFWVAWRWEMLLLVSEIVLSRGGSFSHFPKKESFSRLDDSAREKIKCWYNSWSSSFSDKIDCDNSFNWIAFWKQSNKFMSHDTINVQLKRDSFSIQSPHPLGNKEITFSLENVHSLKWNEKLLVETPSVEYLTGFCRSFFLYFNSQTP